MAIAGSEAAEAAPRQLRHELQELRRQQIEADQRDHRVAHAFELVRPGIDLKPRGVEPKQQHADQRDGGQRLHPRGDEGDDHAAPDRLLVGDDVGGDDGLAVPGAHRVQDAVEEGEPGKRQRAGHGIVGLEAFDAHGERALQRLLLVEHPGEEPSRAAPRLERSGDRTWPEGGRRGAPRSPRTE